MVAEQLYSVVSNDEQQFSIWPMEREPPAGWQRASDAGSRAECLARIGELWTDIRPRSVRLATESG